MTIHALSHSRPNGGVLMMKILVWVVIVLLALCGRPVYQPTFPFQARHKRAFFSPATESVAFAIASNGSCCYYLSTHHRSLTTEAARPREGNGRNRTTNQAPARPRSLCAWASTARQRPAGRGDDNPGHFTRRRNWMGPRDTSRSNRSSKK